MKNIFSGLSQRNKVPPPRLSSFAALGLSNQIQDTLAAAGYTNPTPIQIEAIPHVLNGTDLLGCAQTGTGKTAAFALPILQGLHANAHLAQKGRSPKVLVIAPTRELAAQIGASFAKYGGQRGPRQLVVFGGVSKQGQIRSLRQGVDVLVATPGRLLDLMNDGVVRLDQVETFVLDEADRMLDMGFIHDVKRITKALPQRRQTLMFSATMPPEIARLAGRIQRNPTRVNADPVSSTREPIAQSVYHVEKSDKTSLLLHLLEGVGVDRALVFTRTKHGANRLAQKLDRVGIATAAIHGNKSQSARERTLQRFKAGELRVVVATDIAARGIDIKDLSHVVNFDLPNEPESYVHRIGRTGRAGAAGVAVSFCSNEERSYLRDIERLTHKRLDECQVPKELETRATSPSSETSRRPRGNNQRRRRRATPMTAEQALSM